LTHRSLSEVWESGRAALGGWVAAGGEFSLSGYRRAGYDYVGIDCQHSALDEAAAAVMLQRASPADPATIVRVSKNDSALIGRLADAGADGIIVPMVSTAQQAREAVAAIRYPPAGVRSFGPTRPDLPASDLTAMAARVSLFVMIETAEGLGNVEEITQVPGLSGVYVGPADLSIGLGMEPMRAFTTDQLAEAVERIRTACEASGIVLGMHQIDGASARPWIGRGVRLATLGSDLGVFIAAARAELQLARDQPAAAHGESAGSPYGG
jgi:4-hydroxy-2-oxoheptanedioate aldolase